MVISNARYEKKHAGTKNRGYFTQWGYPSAVQADEPDFEIPRYEEVKFLRLEDFEE